MKVTQLCPTLQPHGLYSLWNSVGQNTGVDSLSLHQEIFPTQGSNPCLLHCRWILYQLSPQESPRILEWVVYPSSSKSSWSRSWTRISRITGRFFTTWAIREAQGFIIQGSVQMAPPQSECPDRMRQSGPRLSTSHITLFISTFVEVWKDLSLSVVYLFVTWIFPLEK